MKASCEMEILDTIHNGIKHYMAVLLYKDEQIFIESSSSIENLKNFLRIQFELTENQLDKLFRRFK